MVESLAEVSCGSRSGRTWGRRLAFAAILASCVSCGGRLAAGGDQAADSPTSDQPGTVDGSVDAADANDTAVTDGAGSYDGSPEAGGDADSGPGAGGRDAEAEPDAGEVDHDGSAWLDGGPPDGAQEASAGPVIASGQANPWSIAVDNSNVYWTTLSSSGVVMQMPKAGGAAPLALATNQYDPFGIVVDGTYAYWSDSLGAIKRVPIGGGTVTTLATLNGNVGYSLAVNSTTLFVGGDELVAMPKGGGTVDVLATDQGQTWGMAIDETNVYWSAESGNGSVNYLPLGGGAVTPLVSNVNDPSGIDVDATHVYFTLLSEGKIESVPIAGGHVTEIVTDTPTPLVLRVDSGRLYWASSTPTGAILETDLTSGTNSTIATGLDYPAGVALDASNIYWTVAFAGTIMTASK